MGQSSPGPHTDIMLRYIATTVLLASLTLGARVRRDEGYGAPEPDTYGAPAEAYGAPDTSYSAPSYAADTGLDLTTIIIPLLALLGLFLLFPTYVTLTSVRRKREAIEGAGETTMAHMASVMIPNKYSKYMKQFASAKNCHKLKCGAFSRSSAETFHPHLVTNQNQPTNFSSVI